MVLRGQGGGGVNGRGGGEGEGRRGGPCSVGGSRRACGSESHRNCSCKVLGTSHLYRLEDEEEKLDTNNKMYFHVLHVHENTYCFTLYFTFIKFAGVHSIV